MDTLDDAWLMADGLEAGFSGTALKLQMETLEDTFGKALGRYEYPYADGVELEDLGQTVHGIRIRCYFWDDDGGNQTYEEHKDLLALLARRGDLELLHPVYGNIKGKVDNIAVRHDDRLRTAEVDLTFEEQGRARIEAAPVAVKDVAAATEKAFIDAQEEAMAELSDEIEEALGVEGRSLLAELLDPLQPIAEQLTGLSRQAAAKVREIDAAVATLEAELVAVANPANSLVASINYGTRLPGRVIGAVTRCAERYAILYDSIRTAPARFVDSLRVAMLDLADRTGLGNHVTKAFAHRAGVELAAIYRDDEDERQRLRRQEGQAAFDVLGRQVGTMDSPAVLTVRDLEDSLALAREMMQMGVEHGRPAPSLKAAAAALLDHVNTLKLERENLVEVVIPHPLPLHVVCLQHGLPYGMAERIHSVNRIPNPNVTAGRISIYAR